MLGSGKGEVMGGARWAGEEQGFTGRAGQAQSGAPGPLLLFLSTIVGSLHGLF